MRDAFRAMTALIVGATILALAGQANGQYYWTNSATSGSWTDSGNWEPSGIPSTTSDTVNFTNQAAAAYEVDLTGATTSGVFTVTKDKVTFDLNGQTWLGSGNHEIMFYTGLDTTGVVTFSSSGAPGTIDLGNGTGAGDLKFGQDSFGDAKWLANAVINIDDSLGYGVAFSTPGTLTLYGQTINLSGSNTVFRQGTGALLYNKRVTASGNWNVLNGAHLEFTSDTGLDGDDVKFGGRGFANQSIILSNNATLRTLGFVGVGYGNGPVTMQMLATSTWWSAGPINVGVQPSAGSGVGRGTLVIDASTLYGAATDPQGFGKGGMVIGGSSGDSPTITGYGTVTVQNGGQLILSNGYLLVNNRMDANGTNRLTLNNATIILGSPTRNGALTNQGFMRAAGLIRGAGTGKLLVRNERFLEVGNSLGTLTLSNANLQLALTSSNYFEFNPSQAGIGDAINITAGTALIDGALLFTNTASTLTFGQWNFITADVITNNAWFDNLSNIVNSLTNTLPPDLFAGYTYGVVDLLDGGQALQLSINMIPEPSTILLLVGGGLVLYRVRRKK